MDTLLGIKPDPLYEGLWKRQLISMACLCGTPCFLAEWAELDRRMEAKIRHYLGTPIWVEPSAT